MFHKVAVAAERMAHDSETYGLFTNHVDIYLPFSALNPILTSFLEVQNKLLPQNWKYIVIIST